MSVLTSGSATTTALDRTAPPAPDVVRDQLADSVDWFEGTLPSWRRHTWYRVAALLAMVGAIGDAVTTSRIGQVEGIHEGNPVSAAGQAFVGSVPVFMLVVTVPLVLVFLILANRPNSRYTWFIWIAVACVGAVKFVVTCSNLMILATVAGG